MRSIKIFLVLAISVFGFTALNAQTKASKATKTTNTKKAINKKAVDKADAVYQCPMKCEGDKTYGKEGKCPVCKMNLKKVAKADAVYQCPMKCEGDKTYAKEGKCPVCNMNLAKREAKKGASGHEGHKHN